MGLFKSVKTFSVNFSDSAYYHRKNIKKLLMGKTDGAFNCQIVPEPENKHDRNALRIVAGNMTVGYIPRNETAAYRSIAKKVRNPRVCFVQIAEDEYAAALEFEAKV